jgi:hypothetical protein
MYHWRKAKIIKYSNTQIYIHYIDWSDIYNEWINILSDRIKPFNTYSMDNNSHLLRE